VYVVIKKTWFIWLSIVGFILLWGDTTRRLKFRKIVSGGQFGLWTRACGNMLKLFVLYIILPIVILGNLISFLLNDIFVMEYSLAQEIIMSIFLLIVYFFGVYATHQHASWRRKNMSNLLDEKTECDNFIDLDAE